MKLFHWRRRSGKRLLGSSGVGIIPPKFIGKQRQDDCIYEIYEGTDAESAKEFLISKEVEKPKYYIVVKTPEGNWGMDVDGLYLERLLPWQTETNLAQAKGEIDLISWSHTGIDKAAQGIGDNFIVKVKCGKCNQHWMDGVRYQDITVVRCPKCKTYNEVAPDNWTVARDPHDKMDLDLLKLDEKAYRKLKDYGRLQDNLERQAAIFKSQGDFNGASEVYRQKEDILRKLENNLKLQATLNNHALILKDLGDLEGALALHKEQEQICRELEDKKWLSTCLINQAHVLNDLRDLDGAINLHKEREQICRKLGDMEGLTMSKFYHGHILAESGRFEEALLQVEEAFELANHHGMTTWIKEIKPTLDYLRSPIV